MVSETNHHKRDCVSSHSLGLDSEIKGKFMGLAEGAGGTLSGDSDLPSPLSGLVLMCFMAHVALHALKGQAEPSLAALSVIFILSRCINLTPSLLGRPLGHLLNSRIILSCRSHL